MVRPRLNLDSDQIFKLTCGSNDWNPLAQLQSTNTDILCNMENHFNGSLSRLAPQCSRVGSSLTPLELLDLSLNELTESSFRDIFLPLVLLAKTGLGRQVQCTTTQNSLKLILLS